MTGRAVHIYRKRTMILSKEQAKEYKDLEKKAIAEEKKNDLKKWEGVSMIPRPS